LWVANGESTEPWIRAVSAEVQAAEDAVLVVDRSADAKRVLAGTGLDQWSADHLPSLKELGTHSVMLAPLSGSYGQIESLTRMFRGSDGSVVLLTGPEQDSRVCEWLRRAALPAGLQVNDVTTTHAVLELHGPWRSAVLSALGCKSTGTPSCWIGAVPVTVREDEINGTTLLIAAADGAVHVWQGLLAVG
jgi:glycine cleavage system aminomethyltransferase T